MNKWFFFIDYLDITFAVHISNRPDHLGHMADSAGARMARSPAPLVGLQVGECAEKDSVGKAVREEVHSSVSGNPNGLANRRGTRRCIVPTYSPVIRMDM